MPVALLMIALGGTLVWGGCWVLWSERSKARFPEASQPTRQTMGVTSIFAGYHLVAYALPDEWFPIKVPMDRWYVVAVVSAAALLLSRSLDRLRSMSQEGNDTPGP